MNHHQRNLKRWEFRVESQRADFFFHSTEGNWTPFVLSLPKKKTEDKFISSMKILYVHEITSLAFATINIKLTKAKVYEWNFREQRPSVWLNCIWASFNRTYRKKIHLQIFIMTEHDFIAWFVIAMAILLIHLAKCNLVG